ncbi:MAG: HEAT repeat domain-containing protein [Anaerolineaceae bacterium]|nr:HEAT repeat domain-containing protein [Anaerolineaceae bacterium]
MVAAETIDVLILLLADENQDVRWCAAEALGKIGDSRAVDALIQSASDEIVYVREAAIKSLGQLQDPRAVDALKQALNDPYNYICSCAIESLGKIGDLRAIDTLVCMLFASNTRPRRQAIKALEEIGSPAVDALLRAIFYQDSFISQIISGVFEGWAHGSAFH